MGARITAAQVWKELERQIFAVVGFVSAKEEARTVGVAYVARDRKLYICTKADSWKTKHLRNNPNVSVTVPITKRIPFIPWVKIPSATITFSGTGRILDLSQVPAEIPDTLLNHLKPVEVVREHSCVVEITPKGNFLTYGVAVPLRTMLRPLEAAGRTPVE